MYPPFVDREAELNVLQRYAERGFYPVLYVYGPEGCGKTRLLKELISRLKGREGYLAVYIDAQSTGSVEEALTGSREVVELLTAALEASSGPVGRLLALLLTRFTRWLDRRVVRGEHVVVAVDDVAVSLGVELAESYAKSLLSLVEQLYSYGASSVLVVASTSEGESPRRLARHSYVRLVQLWNLSRDAALQLMDVLGAPEEVWEEVWRLTGGNPRSIVELAVQGWDIGGWLEAVERSVSLALGDAVKRYGAPLAEVVEDVDVVDDYPELRRLLVEANLVTPVTRPCLGYTPPVDPGLGVGRRWAWQLPVYRHAVRRLLEGGPGA